MPRPTSSRVAPVRSRPLPLHALEPDRLVPLDRRLPDADRAWLQPVPGGPPAPPKLPPVLPRTAFDRPPWDESGAPACEPPPFHPVWVVTALLVWAGLWLSLYIASGWLLHQS